MKVWKHRYYPQNSNYKILFHSSEAQTWQMTLSNDIFGSLCGTAAQEREKERVTLMTTHLQMFYYSAFALNYIDEWVKLLLLLMRWVAVGRTPTQFTVKRDNYVQWKYIVFQCRPFDVTSQTWQKWTNYRTKAHTYFPCHFAVPNEWWILDFTWLLGTYLCHMQT